MTRPVRHLALCCCFLTGLSLSILAGCGSDSTDASTKSETNTETDAGSSDSSSASDAGATDSASTKKDAGPGIKCHPVNNTGCPAGQHCVWEGNAITCIDDGEHAAGADCSDGKGCKIGICVGVQGSDKSVCSPHCLANLECASGVCNKLTDSKGKVCDMGVQVAQCNPLVTGCDAGKSCYAGGNGFVCMTQGAVEDGKPCPEDNSCAPGLACVGKSGSSGGVCRKICKMGGGLPACDDISSNCSSLLGSTSAGYCGG